MDEAPMAMAAQSPDDAMAWYRATMVRAKMLARQRWIPDYIDVDQVAVALLDLPANDLIELLDRHAVDLQGLRASLITACDAWVQAQGLELGYGCETVGGGAPTPRLREALRLLCPDGDGCGRCVFCASDLLVALTRAPHSFLRAALGERIAGMLAALPLREACERARD